MCWYGLGRDFDDSKDWNWRVVVVFGGEGAGEGEGEGEGGGHFACLRGWLKGGWWVGFGVDVMGYGVVECEVGSRDSGGFELG